MNNKIKTPIGGRADEGESKANNPLLANDAPAVMPRQAVFPGHFEVVLLDFDGSEHRVYVFTNKRAATRKLAQLRGQVRDHGWGKEAFLRAAPGDAR